MTPKLVQYMYSTPGCCDFTILFARKRLVIVSNHYCCKLSSMDSQVKKEVSSQVEAQISDQMKKEVSAALDRVAKKKCKNGYYIDKKDMDEFLGVLTRRGSEEVSEIRSVHSEYQWKNDLSVPFQIPHEHSSHVKTRFESNQDRGVKVEAGAKPCNNLKAGFDIHAGHKSAHVEEEVRMSRSVSVDAPPQSITKRTFGTTEKVNNVTICAPANCNIHVYKNFPKKVGAVVGGVGGMAGGAAGGATAGAVIGAVVGSVVPVAGNIVGGVVGGIVGGVLGVVGVGGVGAAAGAGVGHIFEKNTPIIITAQEVFQELSQQRVSCVVPENFITNTYDRSTEAVADNFYAD